MKIVIKDPADLQDALDLRAKVDHHAAVAQAVAAKQQKKQRAAVATFGKLDGAPVDGVTFIDEAGGEHKAPTARTGLVAR